MDLIFASGAAEGVHVNNVRNRLELVHDEPVVECLQFHHVIFRIGAGQRVEHDLAGGTVIGADSGGHAGRERDVLQAIEDLLTCVKGGDVVVINERDDGEAHQRDRAQVGEMSNSVEFHFERNRDLLLDFFCGVTRPLRDDLRVGIGDVGIRLDGQGVEGNDAPDEKHEGSPENEKADWRGQNRWPCGSFSFPISCGDFGGEFERVG